MTDQYVYVHDKDYAWIPALVVDQNDKEATVKVAKYKSESEIQGGLESSSASKTLTVKLKDYANNALPLQNLIEGRVKQVADMIELGFLHEAAILFNLKARHVHDMPYTRTGDIVIAVNPYQWFEHLYTEENRNHYSRTLVWDAAKKDYDPRQDLPPHVYETSALAYRGLSLGGCHQSILVSGESGAGKTETVKICMNHLASVVQQEHQQDGAAQDQDVITRVLDSNPLLEAFGNAKTRRNDNSSRFGKYLQLQFSRGQHDTSHLTLLGSECQVYLLEKSRVVRHEDEERTFHIFYQILAASDSVKNQFWDQLVGTTSDSFSYVGDSETKMIEGLSDADQFDKTLESLAIIGIQGPILQTFMQAICVVLQLGNLIFSPDASDGDKSVIASTTELQHLADLMGIPGDKLEVTLTQRVVKVRREETLVPLSPEAAKDSADALAKQIYDRVFLWLVDQINKATTASKGDKKPTTPVYPGDEEDEFGLIGLLDIFGFESFPVNSFEQLCINYANEQLQAKFTKDVFVSVFEEYQEEGLSLDEIKYDDNTNVLDLIQNRTGLLAMLNEECIRPNGSDYGFVNKALHSNKASPALIIPRIVRSEVEFGIRHYAGDVIYDATDFVVKNQDTLPTDLMECARTSTNDIIAKHLVVGVSSSSSSSAAARSRGAAPKRKQQSNLVAPTAWTKYKEQLNRLMRDLKKTQSRYIRCVKPNSAKKPRLVEHSMTLQQLRSSGVISAVTLARSAFPNRLEHILIMDRFFPLWPPGVERTNGYDPETVRRESEILLTYALKTLEEAGVKAFVSGNTRAYFRGGALEYLEAERLRGMERPATIMQAVVRGFVARRKTAKLLAKARRATDELESDSVIIIQCAWRIYQARLAAVEMRKQAKTRAKQIKEAKRRKRAAIRIQCAARVYFAKGERERRYVRYIKNQAKLLKRQKKLRKLVNAATVIQALIRGVCIRLRYRDVWEKVRERNHLREKIEKIKRKIAKATKNQEKERERAKQEIDTSGGREAWEQSVVSGESDHKPVPPDIALAVDYLQTEHRQLGVHAKTVDGVLKPLKKNFDVLMKENKRLREAFAEVSDRAQSVKGINKDITDRRTAAEKKTKELKEELSNLSDRIVPVANSRVQFQKALTEVMEVLDSKCRNTKLIREVRQLIVACSREAIARQEKIDAEFQVENTPSKARKTLSASFSNLAMPKTPLSAGGRPQRKSLVAGVEAIGSPGLAPAEPRKGKRSSYAYSPGAPERRKRSES